MRPLSFQEIHALWQEKAEIEPEDVQQLVETMGNKQPYVIGYLLAAGDDILGQSEREVVFYIGILLLHVIDSLEIKPPEITLEFLRENEEKNYKMLEYLSGEPESQFLETVNTIMCNYNQSVLLKYIIDQIMEEPDKGVELVDNHLGIMAIYLKTVLDCIDSIT